MFNHETAHELNINTVFPSATEVAAGRPAANGVDRLSARIQAELGPELLCVEELIAEATRSSIQQVDLLGRRAAAMGGKRLRPVLMLLSARLCGASHAHAGAAHSRSLFVAAAAVELVHAASLVHDDVMDRAAQRRHQATISHQFGDSTAVLLGDYLFTRAYALAASCNSTYVARKIASAATQLCEGELQQQFSAANWALSAREYKDILVQKTAALCEVSCRLGAWRSVANGPQRGALSRFGRSLGLAFQIFDDWLDYWGDERVGKTLGTDLSQFKPTLPLIRLFETATPATCKEIVASLAAGDVDARELVRRELDDCDAAEFTLRIAKRYAEKAKNQLECFPKSNAKECLLAVADYSVRRAN